MPRKSEPGMWSLLLLGSLLALNSLRANDASIADATVVENSELQRLVDRIESLERRLAALESRSPNVQLVDSRGESELSAPPALIPAAPRRQSTEPSEQNRQKTNGQSWGIRLLGHRTSQPESAPAK